MKVQSTINKESSTATMTRIEVTLTSIHEASGSKLRSEAKEQVEVGSMTMTDDALTLNFEKKTATLSLARPFRVHLYQKRQRDMAELHVVVAQHQTKIPFCVLLPHNLIDNLKLHEKASIDPLVTAVDFSRIWKVIAQKAELHGHPVLPKFSEAALSQKPVHLPAVPAGCLFKVRMGLKELTLIESLSPGRVLMVRLQGLKSVLTHLYVKIFIGLSLPPLIFFGLLSPFRERAMTLSAIVIALLLGLMIITLIWDTLKGTSTRFVSVDQNRLSVGDILHESRFIKASIPLQDVGHFRFNEMKGGSQLTLVRRNGERDFIIDELKRPQDALFLQQTLSSYLNIRHEQ